MNPSNIFEPLPAELAVEAFDTLARSGGVTIERIVSRGHTSPDTGWYDQDHREWVIVLRGRARLEFESGEIVELAEGDHVDIPSHVRHRVIYTSSAPETVWLAVHYPAGRGDSSG